SFTWFNDLLTDHAELFWSLFNSEMMAVMETKSPDSWDSFPLFQILNDYLITDENLRDGKFHMQIRELFTPMVVRYVDLMESSISQSIKGSAEGAAQWSSAETTTEPAPTTTTITTGVSSKMTSLVTSAASAVASNSGVVGAHASNIMSAAVQAANAHHIDPSLLNVPVTSEELIWKLEALQNFIRELHWPDPDFAEQLDNRLKLMAAGMIDSAAKRNVECFGAWLQKGSRSTDFILPIECCGMINTVSDLKASILKLCTKETAGEDMHQYQNQTESNLEKYQRQLSLHFNEKASQILENSLSKLARHDANTILSSVLSLAVSLLPHVMHISHAQKQTDEMGKAYVEFIRVNLEQMRQKVTDELYILQIMETWYMTQMRMMNEWLQERKSHGLSQYQYQCISMIIKKMYADFELQGISPDALDTMAYKVIIQRLQVEETTQSVRPDNTPSLTNPRSLIGSITGGISGISSNFSKPGFFPKIG
ncbi:Ca -dependent secretion activator, partial [Cichlidogyrus casuarinus]